MSQTYRRYRQKKAFSHLADSSSDLIDYRSRLCYVGLRRKHPKWDVSIVKALAETKGLFVTLLQRPLEWMAKRDMTRRMKSIQRALNKHIYD